MTENERDKDKEEAKSPQNTEDVLVLIGAEKKQKEIRDALLSIDPDEPALSKKLASVYEGVVVTSKNKKNPDYIAQASHSARELTEKLPLYFRGIPIPESSEEKAGEYSNRRKMLNDLIDRHPERNELPAYLRRKFVDGWVEVNRQLIKQCHHYELRNKKIIPSSEKEFEAFLWKYEDLLHQILVERTFFEGVEVIDDLLKVDTPTEEDIGKLVHTVSQPEQRRYFFERCNNPKWLKPLKDIDAFSDPQEVQREGGYIRFLGWPESQYLSRIADSESEEVFEIIKNINTDNQSVLDDFVEAALKSPTNIASKYADLIIKKRWIQNPYNLRLPDKIAELMEKLAKEGYVENALKLARVLFDTKADSPTKLSDDGHPLSTVWHNARAHFDDWRLGEIVKNKTKHLSEKDPGGLFGVLASCLHQALDLEGKTKNDNKFYDHSHIWRPNMGKSRSSHENTKNILLDGLVDLIDKYESKLETLKKFIEILKKHHVGLFKRIEIYIYLKTPNPFTKEIEEILTDPEVITSYNLRREYLPLLGKEFVNLSEISQQKIIQTISDGPDLEKPDGMPEERFDRMNEDWKALYFSQIKDFLPRDEESFYSRVVEKYGEPKDSDGEVHSWEGGQSPISSEDLNKKEPDDVLKYLMGYKPPEDPFHRYSSGGLGMVFAGVVSENPTKYISLSSEFVRLKTRPIFVYHFVNGLNTAVKNGKCFEWEAVINLFYEIVCNENAVDQSSPANEDEQDWKSVLRTISDFLGRALGQDTCDIPVTLREKAWEIISTLAENPEPTPEYEKRDGEGGLDPMTLAINTIRGEAMHGVINYGLWLARNNVSTGENKMPKELSSLLDTHLDINKDPSLAVRSVYGWRLPNLFYLNKQWLEKNKEKIFDKKNLEYLRAAWEGYLANNVLKEVVHILKQEYLDFISYLGTFEKREGFRTTDADQRFPQHIMVIHVNDQEHEHDDLIKEFFSSSPVSAKAEGINFAGRVVLREIENFSDSGEVKQKLSKLWRERLDASADQEELKEFGWWFKSSPIGDKETLDQMIKTLELTNGNIDVPYEIIEKLVDMTNEYPVEAIKILDMLAHSDQETHEISYKKEEYRQIIKKVKETENIEAIGLANTLINYLGSRGFTQEFRDLL